MSEVPLRTGHVPRPSLARAPRDCVDLHLVLTLGSEQGEAFAHVESIKILNNNPFPRMQSRS